MTAKLRHTRLLRIFLLLVCSFSLQAKPCTVGLMTCQDYCSGALVIKLYQLIEQGLKPLCNIDVDYQEHSQTCRVKLLSETQTFNRSQLISIALLRDRLSFNKLLNAKFKSATYQCPNMI